MAIGATHVLRVTGIVQQQRSQQRGCNLFGSVGY